MPVTETQTLTIDSILNQLDNFRQRATYGAVANLLNRAPRNLMGGRSRTPRDSWIVSQKDGMPTGYQPDQVHAEISARERVLRSGDELKAWLGNPM